jgi:Ubiquitin elongating factor core
MNETNSLVASVMEKLPEIRAIQVQQKDTAAWNSLTDERRTEVTPAHLSVTNKHCVSVLTSYMCCFLCYIVVP